MTTKTTNNPTTQREKQLTPLKGEISVEEARVKANRFAAQIKAKMKSRGATFK